MHIGDLQKLEGVYRLYICLCVIYVWENTSIEVESHH